MLDHAIIPPLDFRKQTWPCNPCSCWLFEVPNLTSCFSIMAYEDAWSKDALEGMAGMWEASEDIRKLFRDKKCLLVWPKQVGVASMRLTCTCWKKKVQTYLIYWQCMVDTVDGQNPAPLGAGFFHQLSNWLGSWVVRDRTAIKSELRSILLATAKYV